MLVGRGQEQSALADLLDEAAAGHSRTLLLEGDPGVGKTALLLDAADVAASRGFRTVLAAAVESERGIPGAAVSVLVALLSDVVDELDEDTGRVLRSTMRGVVDDRLPGALLALLGQATGHGPLLVTADDVQWWDPESLAALLFAARRLVVDQVAVLLAGRPVAAGIPLLSSVPQLPVAPLTIDSAVALLRALDPRIGPAVAATLATSLAGNPLALLEAGTSMDPRILAGGLPLPEPVPVGLAVRYRWAAAVGGFTPSTRLSLAVLAADETGSGDLTAMAWTRLGCTAEDLVAAETAGLVALGARGWTMSHPLVRSAVYSTLTPAERRAAHGALAEVLRGSGRDASFARHLAAATMGADAHVAATLTDVAARLAADGSYSAAAVSADDAVRLTPPGPGQVERLVAAATYALRAQDDRRAARLAAEGFSLGCDAVDASRLRRVLGVATGQQGDTRRGVALLREAADGLTGQARVGALVDALAFVKMWNEPDESLALIAEMGDLDRLEPWMSLDVGNTLAAAGRWSEAVPLLRRGLAGVDPAATGVRETVSDAWADAAAIVGLESYAVQYRDAARRLRSSGSAVMSESGLSMEIELAHAQGRWSDADVLNEECRDLSLALGRVPMFSFGTDLRLSARRGDPVRFEQTENDLREAAARAGLVLVLANADGLQATLLLSVGDDEAAEEPLRRTVSDAPPGMLVTTVFPSAAVALVELLARRGRVDEARELAGSFLPRLTAQPSNLAHAYAERLLAVTEPKGDVEAHLVQACLLHDAGMHAFEAARAHLLLGQWLRRRRRRAEAATHLTGAMAAFEAMRAAPWAVRCRKELSAAGVDVRRQHPHDAVPVLTAQERSVAEAAAEGLSNAGIAHRMFLSPKTVELHLTHAYRKLGVAGRHELPSALAIG